MAMTSVYHCSVCGKELNLSTEDIAAIARKSYIQYGKTFTVVPDCCGKDMEYLFSKNEE